MVFKELAYAQLPRLSQQPVMLLDNCLTEGQQTRLLLSLVHLPPNRIRPTDGGVVLRHACFCGLGGVGKLVCPCRISETTGFAALAHATRASSAQPADSRLKEQ